LRILRKIWPYIILRKGSRWPFCFIRYSLCSGGWICHTGSCAVTMKPLPRHTFLYLSN
jgi:hypothetical protein